MEMEKPGQNPVHAALADVEKTFSEAAPIELSILMPCLNEAETLGICIDKARAFLWRTKINGEIVIADNGSDDGSQAIARAHGARVVAVPSRGYGAALIAGIHAARGRYVIMGDSDNSYDFADLDRFVEKLREGYDVVMGNRFRGGIAEAAMPPLHRYLGNPVLSFVGRLFFRSRDRRLPLRPARLLARGGRSALGLDSPGMEFASEMVVKATIAELKITEVPTTLAPDGRTRAPHLRSWRDGWRHLKLLFEFAPHWLFLYPGGALASMGALLAVALIPGPVQIGDLTLDGATLLFAVAAILVGTQLVLFYAVAKVAAVAAELLPASERFERMNELLTVDRFCLVGGGFFAVGFLIAAVAVIRWIVTGFGDLDPSANVRLAAFATLGMALGVQSVTAGFLLGLVRNRRRPAIGAQATGAASVSSENGKDSRTDAAA